jgi:cell division protein FtsB
MAKNRKNQSASVHFGPVIKVVLLCFLFCGSAVGYVWQKNEIVRLGRQISDREKKLAQLQDDNDRLGSQVAILRSPVIIDERARQLNLGLGPMQPGQMVLLYDLPPAAKTPSRQFAGRPAMELAQ